MLNWIGIEVGLATFILIGAFHVIVIKCEYYFSKAVWPIFALIGIASLVASLLISSYLISAIVGVTPIRKTIRRLPAIPYRKFYKYFFVLVFLLTI